MGIILDTSLLIHGERGKFDLPAFLEAQGNAEVAISSITASELLHGCERAAGPGIRQGRERFVEAVLARLTVIPFGLMEARHHARIWARLAAKGQPIGYHDLIIAATTLSLHYELATLNPKHFSPIQSLKLVPLGRFEM